MPRVRAFDLFSSFFAGACPPRSFPAAHVLAVAEFSLLFLPFAIPGERGGLSCYLRAAAGDIVAADPGNMGEFGY